MKAFVAALFFVHVLSSLVNGAAIEMYESEKPVQTEGFELTDSLRDNNNQDEYYPDEYDDTDYDEYSSGDDEIIFPRVAFSTKPKESPPVTLIQEHGKKRKGKGKRKGQGRKRNPCLKKFKDLCIHGVCQYIKDLRMPSCICQTGYTGERCHLFSLPVVKEGERYDRTTALAVVAVILSSVCLLIIGILLALRYHKSGAYNVENEEKVKLGIATNH
ncbi:proheparin-binding EGF-like growth factor [Amia ocellicauda]|uniref:proheparin-binding EGF-like growth factor n=1 Tax=Amia ocellicauda TaxID=2972642 RepID=UPI003463DF43